MSAAVEMNAAPSTPAAVETTVGEAIVEAPVTMTAKPTSYGKTTVVTFSAIAPYTSPAPVTAVIAGGNVAASPLPTVTVGTAGVGDAPATYKVVSPPAYLETARTTEGTTVETKTAEPITTTTMDYSAPAPVTYFTGPITTDSNGDTTAVVSQDADLGYSAPAMAYKPVTYYARGCEGEPSPVITYSAMTSNSPVTSTVVQTASTSLPATSESPVVAPTKQTTYKVAAPVYYSLASAAPLPPKVVASNVIIQSAATTTTGTSAATLVSTAKSESVAVDVDAEPKSTDSKQTVAKVVRRKIGCC